ncbi:MAG: hypothetical protein CL881_08095 [Dehalococcoidia bacterium]|nr:hypothetical protein [Dehalococcoidia bacterium]
MAGRVQILAKGHVSDQLLNNPSFSFFTKKISKYTNWSDETFKMTFNKDIHTGDFIDATIPAKYGDVLKGVTLSFKVEDILGAMTNPPASMLSLNPPDRALIEKFGVSVIDYVELFLGDQLIDRVTGHDIFIYNELHTPESQHGNLTSLQGSHFVSSYGSGTFVQEWLDGQHQQTVGGAGFADNEYRTHIPFYFHNRPKHGFPLYAVNKQELKLRIKLRPARELLFVNITSTYTVPPGEYDSGTTVNMPLSYIWDPIAERSIDGNIKLQDFTVDLDLVYLDKSERCKLQSKPFNVLIEQHQHNKFYIEPRSKYGEFRLDFKNPIKEMYFIAKNDRPELDEPIFSNNLNQIRGIPYSAYGFDFTQWQADVVYAKKPVPLFYSQQELVTLECDGVKILNEITGNSKFLAYSIPHIYHKRSPVGRRINVYSFALYPDKLEPSGHLDFSVIKDAKLTMSLTRDGSFGPSTAYFQVATGYSPLYFFKEVRVIAKSYNVLRFENGAAKLLF